MENAADALKIGFAALMFVIAVTITFTVLSQARETADIVLYAIDRTNFYPTYTRSEDNGIVTYIDSDEQDGDRIITKIDTENRNRVVGKDTVISTLYRYHKESFCVTIIDLNGDLVGRFDVSTETEAPWRGSRESSDKRLDYFLSLSDDSSDPKINDIKLKFGGESGKKDSYTGNYYISEQPFKKVLDLSSGNNPMFIEEFVEVNYSGEYLRPGDDIEVTGEQEVDDGTVVTIASGAKMVYITYRQIR